jgi:hypothetical protein
MSKNNTYESLYAFLDYFSAPSTMSSGGLSEPPCKNGVLVLPFPYSKQIIQFFTLLSRSNFSHYDTLYPIFRERNIERSFEGFEKAIPSADKDLLISMLLQLPNAERLCDGVIASAINKGFIAAILQRLKLLLDEERAF